MRVRSDFNPRNTGVEIVQRIIITGANGSGKSYFAKLLTEARPDLPLFSFDTIKLTKNWQTRPKTEIAQRLNDAVSAPVWILEGGPSLLPCALPYADCVVWLDPPVIAVLGVWPAVLGNIWGIHGPNCRKATRMRYGRNIGLHGKAFAKNRCFADPLLKSLKTHPCNLFCTVEQRLGVCWQLKR